MTDNKCFMGICLFHDFCHIENIGLHKYLIFSLLNNDINHMICNVLNISNL